MVWKEMHQQTSSQSPQTNNYSYFTEQARRVGHMGSELGRNQSERFPDHHHQQQQQQQHLHPQTHPHPRFFAPPRSLDMHEAIQREIEKERIREEIIISDMVRRRVLEAEVRRELMMERELALRRGGDGFPFGLSPIAGFDSPMGISFLGTRTEGSSLEERLAFSLTERERLNGRHESGRFESLPFQRRSADLRISEDKPVLEGGKEKEKILLLGKPDENISGSKRKAPPPPPPRVDASEPPRDIISAKKAREDWSCALCQVSATSKKGLSEHLQGKKHKSKEAALRAQRAGKSYSIGLLPKRDEKTLEASSKRDDDPPLLNETLKSDKSKKDRLAVVQNGQKNDDPKKKKYRFWCEMCQVGTASQKVMNAHKKGKKHVGRLERSNRNGGDGPSDQKEKIVMLVNREGVGRDGEGVAASDGVDMASEEARSEDRGAIDETEVEDRGAVDEAEVEDRVAVDITEPGVADEAKGDELTVS